MAIRLQHVSIHMSKEEALEIGKAARAQGVTISWYLREKIGLSGRPHGYKITRKDIEDYIYEHRMATTKEMAAHFNVRMDSLRKKLGDMVRRGILSRGRREHFTMRWHLAADARAEMDRRRAQ